MKKKLYTGIIAIAVSMSVAACTGGSNSPKNEIANMPQNRKKLNADVKQQSKRQLKRHRPG